MALTRSFFIAAAMFVVLVIGAQGQSVTAQDVVKEDSQSVAVVPLRRCTKEPLPVNENAMPIRMPIGGELRGLSLSGECKLSVVGEAGSANLEGVKAHWNKHYSQSAGCALLHAYVPVLLQCNEVTVYVSAGTTVVTHIDPDGSTRVVNLTDKHRHSVRVFFRKHFVDLNPGVEMVLVPCNGEDAKSVAFRQNIGWKNLNHTSIGDTTVFVFRVSTKDMLEACRIYRHLTQSNSPQDKKIRDELVKTVAAVETMFTKMKGPYTLSDPYLYGRSGERRDKLQTARSHKGSA